MGRTVSLSLTTKKKPARVSQSFLRRVGYMSLRRTNPTKLAAIFLRLALAAGFLSAVADRFGLWGPAGAPGVAWGGFEAFLAYTGDMLWYLPAELATAAGWTATVLEILLAMGLLLGIKLRLFAFASGFLLTVFAVAMTAAFGFEPPLSYSVWSAAAGALLLGSLDLPT
jgi:uncharacterized membrane protein YphA (DoxX/SURF4 family)